MSVSALEKSASAFPADFLKSPPSEGRNAQIITTIDLPISWMELGLTPENLSECCLLQMTDVLHVSSPQLEEITYPVLITSVIGDEKYEKQGYEAPQ
jgi:hypothetical protein